VDSVEVLCYLLAYKALYLHNIFILRDADKLASAEDAPRAVLQGRSLASSLFEEYGPGARVPVWAVRPRVRPAPARAAHEGSYLCVNAVRLPKTERVRPVMIRDLRDNPDSAARASRASRATRPRRSS